MRDHATQSTLAAMTTTVLGHSVHRSEDPRHLTGEAQYADDLDVPDAAHAVFVRSPYAHARIRSIDVGDASTAPGVVAVLTAADLDLRPLDATGGNAAFARPQLADDRVRFAGEAVAVVVAHTRAQAADAAECVVVDYEPLAAVNDQLAAMAPGAPLLFDGHGSNVVADRAPRDDPDFFAGSAVVLRERIVIPRVAPVPLETNGCVAAPSGDGLTVWVSTQSVFGVRREIAKAMGVDEQTVRVRAPAVGGGFGAKGGVYPEQIVVAAAARKLGRPVRWAETRGENMLAMTHGRGQVQHVEIGACRDGTVLAMRVHIVADAGAYPYRAFVPAVTRFMASGPYRIPRIDVRVTTVVTNATPTGPYRGAGRPEAAVLCERTMDVVAHELGLDPADVRRRNFIPPEAFPYTSPVGPTYDTGEYARALDEALRIAGYDALREEQRARRARADRRLVGIGIGSYVEVSGAGSEFGSVRIDDAGSVTVVTGSVPHGQGHETAWAQIVSSVLRVPFDSVRVLHSDTGVVARGTGTFGSRSLQLAGSAVHEASMGVLERARTLAAELLEAAVEDVVVHADGRIGVAGAPASALGWTDLARAAHERDTELHAEFDFSQDGTFPFGSHVAVVEVDAETGHVTLVRHVAVDDCGRVLNPMLAQGQVHGGIAQGAAQVLYETVRYDDDGNPLTATLADYMTPGAPDLPAFETAHTETPTPHNPLGAKGIGESGTTGSLAAVWNAVVDALGLRHLDLPFTPERVWTAAASS
jgi:carbon-monoxide dehydrogenase large subunit